jgi:hypothetical protein
VRNTESAARHKSRSIFAITSSSFRNPTRGNRAPERRKIWHHTEAHHQLRTLKIGENRSNCSACGGEHQRDQQHDEQPYRKLRKPTDVETGDHSNHDYDQPLQVATVAPPSGR